ncbi:MAG: 50S ribosomal protein L2 [Verrucomicrobiales bacterium]|nr:50S ribosomal protein L2 [Verrucomicrobiales bacterium]
MPVKSFKPFTPSRRFFTVSDYSDITKKKPEKKLTYTRKKTGGRNNTGRITAWGIGGGHKQKVRNIDFRRKAVGDVTVEAIEYDPIRSARIALVKNADGKKSYIIAHNGCSVGDVLSSGPGSAPKPGNCLPLSEIPAGMAIHNIELTPGKGGQIVRAAGGSATLMANDGGYAQVKLPSGEIRKINGKCRATIGQVSNPDHEKIILGKAGRNRNLGKRPQVRGVAMNPVDHPMGGGGGRTSGGGHPVTPWGVITKGYKTRKRKKYSNRFIVQRRDGRLFKRK